MIVCSTAVTGRLGSEGVVSGRVAAVGEGGLLSAPRTSAVYRRPLCPAAVVGAWWHGRMLGAVLVLVQPGSQCVRGGWYV